MSDPEKPDRRLQAGRTPSVSPAAGSETHRPADSTPVVAGPFASLPLQFGRYEVQKLLGRGAMGTVYLARDTLLDRPVALKIPKVAAMGSKHLLRRLETEAKAAARLDHPSLCKVFDAGAIDGQSFIAMQYIEGETLKSQLEVKPKSVAAAVALITQLAEGLSEAHALGIVHRDLKPENIIINRRGTPVIMDFGLAKFSTFGGNAAATRAGTILGSPAYMAPEQASGNAQEIDQRSDIYALGVIFFELLTGQWPFNGSAVQILGQKSLLDPASPVTLRPDLPPALAAICTKMIARNSADRYQSLDELLADLRPGHLNQRLGDQPAHVAVPERRRVSSPSSHSRLPDFSVDSAAADIRCRSTKANRGLNRQHFILIGCALLGFAVLIVGVIINLQTKRGNTLVVNVPQPKAKVRVDQAEGKIEIEHQDGSQPTTITEAPNGKGVKMMREGVTVTGQDLEIKSGAEEPITAKLLEPVEIPMAPVATVAPGESDAVNRQAAEYWFKRVTRETKRGYLEVNRTKIQTLTDLPAGSFHITGWNVHHMNSQDLQYVGKLAELVDLNAVNASVSPADLEPLANFKKLENINLTYANINDACLEPLGKITSLKTLNLFGDPVTDHGIQQLAGLKNLTFLELTRSKVTEEGAAKLRNELPTCRIKLR